MESPFNSLRNEMETLKISSDKVISPEKFYLVEINIHNKNIPFDTVKKWGLRFLRQKEKTRPSSVYVFDTNLFCIFPCSDFQHAQGGSHHSLISYHINKIHEWEKDNNSPVSVSIIEFNTKVEIFTYLSYIVYSNHLSFISSLLGGEVNTNIHTHNELLGKVSKKGIAWDDLPDTDKYGCFYRSNSKKGKVGISSLSELFDSRDESKYISFILG